MAKDARWAAARLCLRGAKVYSERQTFYFDPAETLQIRRLR